ncbi:siderophore-interacting protein [Aquicoccus sp. SCR17]|nr:siderophore-interacting protein [Carideicomes alvinocaridis]
MSVWAEGHVALDPALVRGFIEGQARDYDLPLQVTEATVALEIWGGAIQAAPEGAGTALRLRAPEEGLLHAIREAVTEQLGAAGALPDWKDVDAGKLPANMRLAQVVSVTDISPAFRRVRVAGAGLDRFATGGLHFRLLLPPEGRAPVWPVTDERGRTRWPDGEDALHKPVYTVRHLSPAGDWLDFDVFLHEGGRTTDWTARTRPGDVVGLIGPGGDSHPEARHLGLWGDETALPAILRITEALPPEARGEICLRVEAEDLPAVALPEGMVLRRVDSAAALTADLLESALPGQGGYVWFGGEKAEAARIRSLLRARDLPKSQCLIMSYWTAGAEG